MALYAPNVASTPSRDKDEMNAKEEISNAMDRLIKTMNDNGYQVEDMAVDEMTDDHVELFRYPPDTYDQVICAVPAQ